MSNVPEKRIHGIRSPFYPLLVLMLAVLLWFGFQVTQAFGVRAQLKEQYANQEAVMQNAEKMRSQLDGIASDTARLAQAGNPNARIIIEELNKRGITVRTQ